MNEPAQTTTPPQAAAPTSAGARHDHLEDPLLASQIQPDAVASDADPAGGGVPTSELAIYLLEAIGRGDADPLAGLSGATRGAAAPVMAVIQKNRALVDRCIHQGIDRRRGEAVERVVPGPAHAIAGFLGLHPPDPSYLPPR